MFIYIKQNPGSGVFSYHAAAQGTDHLVRSRAVDWAGGLRFRVSTEYVGAVYLESRKASSQPANPLIELALGRHLPGLAKASYWRWQVTYQSGYTNCGPTLRPAKPLAEALIALAELHRVTIKARDVAIGKHLATWGASALALASRHAQAAEA